MLYRKLSPNVEITLSGLDPETKYNVHLRFVTSDKYVNFFSIRTNQWTITPCDIRRKYDQITYHSDSPNTGIFWMSKPVSFHYLRIMNRHLRSTNGLVSLKYFLKSYYHSICLYYV